MPNRRLRQATLAVLCAPLLLASGCSPSDSPAHEGTRRAAQAVISDQLHNGGTEGFFFLPPMVPQSVGLTGDYVPTVNPTVRIDELDRRGGTIRTLATFLTIETYTARAPLSPSLRDAGAGPEPRRPQNLVERKPVTDSDPEGYFFINWETANERLSTTGRYRVRVLVPTANGGTRELGFADVDVVRDRAEFRTVDTVNFTPLFHGGVLEDQVPHRPARGGPGQRRLLRLGRQLPDGGERRPARLRPQRQGRRLRVPRRAMQGHRRVSRRGHLHPRTGSCSNPHATTAPRARSPTRARPADRGRCDSSACSDGLAPTATAAPGTAARPHSTPSPTAARAAWRAPRSRTRRRPAAPAPARSPARRAGPTPTATAPTAASSTSPPTPTAARPATPASPAQGAPAPA